MNTEVKLSKPTVQRIGDSFRFCWVAEGIEAEVDRMQEGRSGITAELIFRSNVAGKEGLLHMGSLNLLAVSTRASTAKLLSQRLQGVDWQGVLEQLCFLTVEEYRQGRPLVDLSKEPLPERPRWLYWPYVEDARADDDAPGPTIFYGRGDSGKSLLALRVALGAALGAPTGPGQGQADSKKVLYLDWETSKVTHVERLHALCAGLDIDRLAMPPVYYLRMDASLPQCAEAVRRHIVKNSIGFVVVDSAGCAGGGPPEEAQTALALYSAVRKLEVPALVIHHQPKPAGLRRQQGDDVYGSVYWYNGARNVWQIMGVKDEQQEELNIGMVHVKANNGCLLKRHAYRLNFTNDALDRTERITIKKMEYSEIPELARQMPLKQRILAELKDGKMTSEELADILDENKRTVQARLSELRKRDKVLNFPEDHTWGLPARETA